ncbi:MAG TPA: sigma-70 family RNA polymerase sigma factor [Gaiellaceae bacterium]|nr:sigma-70 family RNA polymerase sigma factor [Gaiellaceae bacterium]
MELAIAVPALPAVHKQHTMVRVDVPAATDGELITRVAAGDHASFEELYRRYARAILGLARRRLGDPGRAEDATQEAFAAIWRSARSYDPLRGSGAPWLYAVARNAVTDGLRRRPDPVAEPPDVASEEAGPGERAEQSWVAWQVHRAFASLPPHERQVIELAYWRGLSQSEIAAELDIPLGTVKTRTRSALARMADLLDGELR